MLTSQTDAVCGGAIEWYCARCGAKGHAGLGTTVLHFCADRMTGTFSSVHDNIVALYGVLENLRPSDTPYRPPEFFDSREDPPPLFLARRTPRPRARAAGIGTRNFRRAVA